MILEKEWKSRGLACRVEINDEMGFRCGYVQVPKGHLMRGVEYGKCPEEWNRVHGGLTFSGRKDGEWFVGFDCFHFCDGVDPCLVSGQMRHLLSNAQRLFRESGHVWTREEVAGECERLAAMVAAYEGGAK